MNANPNTLTNFNAALQKGSVTVSSTEHTFVNVQLTNTQTKLPKGGMIIWEYPDFYQHPGTGISVK